MRGVWSESGVLRLKSKDGLVSVIQDRVEGGKSAMDLFGGGPASTAASWEQDAFSAFLRDPGIPAIDFRVRQDIPYRP